MKVHYQKLYNMAHLSLNVFTASKGSNNYILLIIMRLPTLDILEQNSDFDIHEVAVL